MGPGSDEKSHGTLKHLLIATAVLHNSPGQLGDGEGGGEAEFEVGAAGLIVAATQVLSAGTLALLARVRAPCQPLHKSMGDLH